jgi:4-aminobutyrate aminotransferase / (S)-3-amino-2-methylpropionate transaminase / 5-aminovalerate transaminase
MHESYIEVAEALGRIAPGPSPKKTFLVNSGAEAVENAVKIARVATGRQGHRRLHPRLPRPHPHDPLADRQGEPLQGGVRAAGGRGLPRRLPLRRTGTPSASDDEDAVADAYLAQLKDLVKTTIGESEVAAFVLEPVAGEGGFIPAPGRFLRGLRAYSTRSARFGSTTRSSPAWAAPVAGGRSTTSTSSPISSARPRRWQRLPAGRRRRHGRVMDKVKPGMLGSTFGGNPAGCAAALATIAVIEDEGLLERSRTSARPEPRALRGLRERVPALGDVRGPGAMVGLEFVREDGITPDPEVVNGVVAWAREHGLILLPTGTYGNVIRLLPPLRCRRRTGRGARPARGGHRHGREGALAVA